MNKAAFDSSAILAIYYKEVGRKKVLRMLEQYEPFISTVNLAEVYTKLAEDGLTKEEIIDSFLGLEITVVSLTEQHAITIAELRSATKPLGLSLGDRACLSLAMSNTATAITADKAWARLGVCKVEVIR